MQDLRRALWQGFRANAFQCLDVLVDATGHGPSPPRLIAEAAWRGDADRFAWLYRRLESAGVLCCAAPATPARPRVFGGPGGILVDGLIADCPKPLAAAFLAP